MLWFYFQAVSFSGEDAQCRRTFSRADRGVQSNRRHAKTGVCILTGGYAETDVPVVSYKKYVVDGVSFVVSLLRGERLAVAGVSNVERLCLMRVRFGPAV